MAQQAPKLAGNVAQRLFNNLKSKDFRDYLMRYVSRASSSFALTLCKKLCKQNWMWLPRAIIATNAFHTVTEFAALISGVRSQIGASQLPLWLIFEKIRILSVAKWHLVSGVANAKRAERQSKKQLEVIDIEIFSALMCYSAVFMRFAWKVQPRNLLLFACHITNFSAQGTQGLRFVNHHYLSDKKQKTTVNNALTADTTA